MTGLLILFIYVALFAGTYFAIRTVRTAMQPASDFNSLKTVTFGDESAVRADRAARF